MDDNLKSSNDTQTEMYMWEPGLILFKANSKEIPEEIMSVALLIPACSEALSMFSIQIKSH